MVSAAVAAVRPMKARVLLILVVDMMVAAPIQMEHVEALEAPGEPHTHAKQLSDARVKQEIYDDDDEIVSEMGVLRHQCRDKCDGTRFGADWPKRCEDRRCKSCEQCLPPSAPPPSPPPPSPLPPPPFIFDRTSLITALAMWMRDAASAALTYGDMCVSPRDLTAESPRAHTLH